MNSPSTLILDRLADGQIGVDEAVRRLMLVRAVGGHLSGRGSKNRATPALPELPTVPSYFDGITAGRWN